MPITNCLTEPVVIPQHFVAALFEISSCPADLEGLISDERTDLSRRQLFSLLREFASLFDIDGAPLGAARDICHRIDTEDARPLRQRPCRVSLSERRTIEKEVEKMLFKGILRPSSSPWSSPVVLVTKKGGSIRFCVDYRRLNKVTRKNVYPVPRIDDALDSLRSARYFSSLDLRSGYWQIPLANDDKVKTAFVTPH